MNKLFKNEKAITLVALVVTIIILLILAGISIVTLTGSGLFENARLAEQKSKNAQEEEQSILGDYENKIGEYIDGNRSENDSSWKRYMMNENGYVVGQEEIILPEKFTELHVRVDTYIVEKQRNGYTFSILYDELDETIIYKFLQGLSNGHNNGVVLCSTKSKMYLQECYMNGTITTKTANVRIWYR